MLRPARTTALGWNVVGTAQPGTGPNALVRALLTEPSGSTLVGGSITQYAGVAPPYLLRLRYDGTFDAGFNASGTGFNCIGTYGRLAPAGPATENPWVLLGNPYPGLYDLERNNAVTGFNFGAASYVFESTGPYTG